MWRSLELALQGAAKRRLAKSTQWEPHRSPHDAGVAERLSAEEQATRQIASAVATDVLLNPTTRCMCRCRCRADTDDASSNESRSEIARVLDAIVGR